MQQSGDKLSKISWLIDVAAQQIRAICKAENRTDRIATR
jgi:hypothetical protein